MRIRSTHLRAPPAAGDAREPASPRGLSLVARVGWQWLRKAYDRLNDSLLGDAIGTLLLGLTGHLIFLAAALLQ